ncbi:hypothetical protein LTR85_012141 [Meristemomyces frigidus]|nr:hypothetical protein LTR85_012141 [Meristemomyces frigidus]
MVHKGAAISTVAQSNTKHAPAQARQRWRYHLTRDLSDAELSEPQYKYAILSHRWGPDEEEVTYDDVVNRIGTSKPGTGFEKIRFCVRQATQDGLRHFWMDTCCIDKSKETELSKALRSMNRWYANAEKCYVFLADVPQTEQGTELGSDRTGSKTTDPAHGPRYKDFSLAFSLTEAAVETQHFVAREGELQEIRANLSSDGSRRIVVLHGLGGIGRTPLAIAYAKRHKDYYSALLWLNAKDEDSVKSSFVKIARMILREHPSILQLTNLDIDQDLERVIDAVKAWLSMPMNTRWLMICDNYDNPKIAGNTDPAALELRQ